MAVLYYNPQHFISRIRSFLDLFVWKLSHRKIGRCVDSGPRMFVKGERLAIRTTTIVIVGGREAYKPQQGILSAMFGINA